MPAESRTSDADAELATLRTRLEALIGQPQVSSDYVGFRADLLTAQWQTYHSLKDPALEASSARAAAPGLPRLDPRSVRFDRSLLSVLLAGVNAAVARHGRGSPDATRLAAAVDRDPALLEHLAIHAAFGPDADELARLADDSGTSGEGLVFFGRALAAPFVTRAAGGVAVEVHSADPQDAPRTCPVCGSPPGLAELRRDDGQRILHCSLCASSWRFARLACPDCGVREPEALRFLRLEAEEPRWVETCERCRAYIKTVDARKLPAGQEFSALIEDTATLHLDVLAEQEGCTRGLPYTALR